MKSRNGAPAPASPPQVPEDVADPFYGQLTREAELASLRRAAHTVALGCRGLLSYLLKLRARWVVGGRAHADWADARGGAILGLEATGWPETRELGT